MMKSKLVYIIDDSEDFRVLVQAIFSQHLPTYELSLFDNGRALTQHIRFPGNVPGLILLDRHMPEQDVYQILQMLKQQSSWRLIPVVMLSSNASRQEMEKCYQLGANSFLKKPVEFDHLKQLLVVTCHYWLELNQTNG